MLALMFFARDTDARSICLKIAVDTDNLALIPKGLYRDWKEVVYRLDKADAGILLVVNPYVRIDKATIKDMLYLMEHKKPVYMILPESAKHRKALQKVIDLLRKRYPGLFFTHYYTEANPEELVRQLVNGGDLQEQHDKKRHDEIFWAIVILVALLALSRR